MGVLYVLDFIRSLSRRLPSRSVLALGAQSAETSAETFPLQMSISHEMRTTRDRGHSSIESRQLQALQGVVGPDINYETAYSEGSMTRG